MLRVSWQDLIAAYRPVFQCPTLVWLSVVVCMQTALDVVINVYAPQKFMDELGMTPQGYGAVMSICSIAGSHVLQFDFRFVMKCEV